jgi:hypothetical protein
VAGECSEQLVRHFRLQGFRIEIAGDQQQGIVMQIPARRAPPKYVASPIVLLAPTYFSEGINNAKLFSCPPALFGHALRRVLEPGD